MHEASIAESILEVAIKECLKNGYNRIREITVEIGIINAINKDSLLFAFDIAKTETIAKDAQLKIIEKPVRGYCNECKNWFDSEEAFVLDCPFCGGVHFTIEGGRELNIIEMEVSDETEGGQEHP